MLSALQKLGETLTAPELQFLEANASALMKNFDVVYDEGTCCLSYVFIFMQFSTLLVLINITDEEVSILSFS